MKKLLVILTAVLSSLVCLPQAIVSYTFDSCSTAPIYVLPGFSATPVTTTAPLTTGCSLGCATGCGPQTPSCSNNTSFITESWTGVVVDFTKYYEFTLIAPASTFHYLTQFSFNYRRSSTGPTNFSLYANGEMKAVGSISGTTCAFYGIGLNQLYTGPINFRLYFWGGAAGGTVRLDNVKVSYAYTSLPIELIYFKANPDRDQVYLEWMTASEINNSHFEIEKSLDGSSFNKLATVNAAGNFQQNTTYFYIDRSRETVGTIYYRLKQVDYDGQFSYSNAVVVTNKLEGVVNVGGTVSLQQHHQYHKANVYDTSGKWIWDLVLGSIRLNGGVYLIECERNGFSSLQTIYIR